MQQAGAFASLPDLIELIARRVAAVVPELPKPPANLKGLESFLDATQKRLEARDHKLLLALDEYENLDARSAKEFSPRISSQCFASRSRRTGASSGPSPAATASTS